MSKGSLVIGRGGGRGGGGDKGGRCMQAKKRGYVSSEVWLVYDPGSNSLAPLMRRRKDNKIA